MSIGPDRLCLLWKIEACYFLLFIYSLLFLDIQPVMSENSPLFVKKTNKKFQKDLNNKSPHEALDFIQNLIWKIG